MKNNANSYLIYLRKSRADIEAEAHGEGETLLRHERALMELAARNDIMVNGIYKEIVSGETIAARPMMLRLLSEVEKGLWAGVLVMEIERLARGDTIDQGIVARTFKYSGTKIITPMKIYDPLNEFDEEYFEFGLFMSRREYKVINRRLQLGRSSSVKDGKYAGNKPPYGYKRKKLEGEKGFTLEPIKDQADAVRMIFELSALGEIQQDGYKKRLGASLIAKRLNLAQISPQNGGAWSASSVRGILNNPVYIGMLRWKWRPAVKKMDHGLVITKRPSANDGEYLICKGRHESVIDEKIYYLAQKGLNDKTPCAIDIKKELKNPLAGIVFCGKCGRTMVRRPHNKGTNKGDTLMCPNAECKNVSSSLLCVEERIVESLRQWLKGYLIPLDKVPEKQISYLDIINKKALLRLRNDLETLNIQKQGIYDLLEQGVYNQETFKNRIIDIENRINKNETEQTLIKGNIKCNIIKDSGYIKTEFSSAEVMDAYNSLFSLSAKNDLLKQLLEKVIYIKDEGGRWHSAPDGFHITLYPKLPRKTNLLPI